MPNLFSKVSPSSFLLTNFANNPAIVFDVLLLLGNVVQIQYVNAEGFIGSWRQLRLLCGLQVGWLVQRLRVFQEAPGLSIVYFWLWHGSERISLWSFFIMTGDPTLAKGDR